MLLSHTFTCSIGMSSFLFSFRFAFSSMASRSTFTHKQIHTHNDDDDREDENKSRTVEWQSANPEKNSEWERKIDKERLCALLADKCVRALHSEDSKCEYENLLRMSRWIDGVPSATVYCRTSSTLTTQSYFHLFLFFLFISLNFSVAAGFIFRKSACVRARWLVGWLAHVIWLPLLIENDQSLQLFKLICVNDRLVFGWSHVASTSWKDE